MSDLRHKKIAEWKVINHAWTFQSHKYRHCTRIYDYLITFVESYLIDTYGRDLKEITDKLNDSKINDTLIPFAAYIIIQGEELEPKIRERVAMTLECKHFSVLENERSKTDYLGYLLSSNIEEDRDSYIQVLNSELKKIAKIIDKEITDAKVKTEVLSWIKKTLTEDDIPAKQYIILFVLHLSKGYKEYFLLGDEDETEKYIKVSPERFIYFLKNILSEDFKKLINGIYTGSLEFVNNAASMYNLIS